MIRRLESPDFIARCPVCGKRAKKAEILPVKDDEERTTLHLACRNCKASALIFIFQNKFGVISFVIPTDLEQSEASNFVGEAAVSADCVIDIHKWLKKSKKDALNFI